MVACALLAVCMAAHTGAVRGAALDAFTKTAGHKIDGHDDGGVYNLPHLHKNEEDCAQACVNDRGCVSFEVGTDGDDKDDCLLSYDTPASVAESKAFVTSDHFDYYEMAAKRAQPLASFAAQQDKLLAGKDTAGVFINITATACAQRCLHTPGCKSFDFGDRTAVCTDAANSGFVNRQTRQPYSCPVLASFGFCLHTTPYAPAIREKCPSACAAHLSACYNPTGACQDDPTAACAASAQLGACEGSSPAAQSLRYRCPATCKAALAAKSITPDFRDELCKDVIGECMLSSYAAGDDAHDLAGAPVVNLTDAKGWKYYERAGATLPPCAEGTASSTGRRPAAAKDCAQCPHDTYANKLATKCEPCPSGYTSPAGSSSIFGCSRGAIKAHDPSAYFQVGELWTGSYWCEGGKTGEGGTWANQGHGRLELYVVSQDTATQELTILRSFQNSFTSGSYYMTAPAAPKLREGLALTRSGWADRPADRYVNDGKTRLTTNMTDLVGNITKQSDGKVAYHGDFCGSGSFSVTRSCGVSSEPTFVKGEHWIGSYRCVDNDDKDRFDIRRLDLVVADVNGSHVKVHSKLEHQDAGKTQGSFRLRGQVETNNRLHLVADGKNAWIRRPGGGKTWYTSDLDGFVTSDHLVFTGSKNDEPSCACMTPCTTQPYTAGRVALQCETHAECPNAELRGGKNLVFCGSSVQSCSKFSVNRVCTPQDNNPGNDDPCACTGQEDSAGRGAVCKATADDDTKGRGPWCHVDSECILAGPDDKNPDKQSGPDDGGVASSGLWWASCAPEGAQPCILTPWVAGNCIPDPNCRAEAPTGTATLTSSVATPAVNGGSCEDLEKEEPCTPSACTLDVITTAAPTTAAPTTTVAATTTTRATAVLTTPTVPTTTVAGTTTASDADATATVVEAATTTTTTTVASAAATTVAAATTTVRDTTASVSTQPTPPTTTAQVTVKYSPVTVVLPTDYNACCQDETARDNFGAAVSNSIASQAQISKPRVTFSPGSVVVTILTRNGTEQAAVSKLAAECGLCFGIKDARVCAHLQSSSACTTGAPPPTTTTTTTTSTTTTSTTTTSATTTSATTTTTKVCPLTCLNGGKCTFVKSNCSDAAAPFDKPICDCGAVRSSVCFYGKNCETKKQCGSDARSCNPFVVKGRSAVSASQVCNPAPWAPGVCSKDAPAAPTPAPAPAPTTSTEAPSKGPLCTLKCTNGGTCVFTKLPSLCDDGSVGATNMTCLCPYKQGRAGTSCYFGKLCESTQACPSTARTKSCNPLAADGPSQTDDPRGICSAGAKPEGCYDKTKPLFVSGASVGEKPAPSDADGGDADATSDNLASTTGVVVAALLALCLVVAAAIFFSRRGSKEAVVAGPNLVGYNNPLYGAADGGEPADIHGVSNPLYNASASALQLGRDAEYGEASSTDPVYAELHGNPGYQDIAPNPPAPFQDAAPNPSGYQDIAPNPPGSDPTYSELPENGIWAEDGAAHDTAGVGYGYDSAGAVNDIEPLPGHQQKPAYVDISPGFEGQGEGEGYLNIVDEPEYDQANQHQHQHPDAMYDTVGAASVGDENSEPTYDTAARATAGAYDTAANMQ